MTKADIAQAIYERFGGGARQSKYIDPRKFSLPTAQCTQIVDTVFEVLKQTLEEGEKVKLSGFGSFEVKEKTPRKGRNPQTGEALTIEARRRVSFKPGPRLKTALNGQGSPTG